MSQSGLDLVEVNVRHTVGSIHCICCHFHLHQKWNFVFQITHYGRIDPPEVGISCYTAIIECIWFKSIVIQYSVNLCLDPAVGYFSSSQSQVSTFYQILQLVNVIIGYKLSSVSLKSQLQREVHSQSTATHPKNHFKYLISSASQSFILWWMKQRHPQWCGDWLYCIPKTSTVKKMASFGEKETIQIRLTSCPCWSVISQ